jgi:hypothetical protein
MTQNAVFLAKLLKANPIPERDSNVRESIVGGAMGFKGK